MSETMRLVKFLAAAGVASRRKAADLVAAGAITINGKPPLGPGDQVSPDDTVTCHGVKVVLDPSYYLLLNKPCGYTCTNFDKHAEKTIFELISLPNNPRLFSAGRLDKESEGMLIITNDGDYAEKLMHPSHEVLKTYLVWTNRPIILSELERLRGGIIDEGEGLSPRRIDEISPGNYRFILNEGKKREIRRLVRATGVRTEKLQRVQIGQLKLGSLPLGKWRNLTPKELKLSLKN